MRLIDANVFMYAAGKAHPHKGNSLKFLKSLTLSKNRREFCINTEIIQEIFHRYQAINYFDVATVILEAILTLEIEILAIEYEDIIYCHKILKDSDKLSARDAIHAAVIRRRGLGGIVSFDRDFDGFADIERVEPGDILT